jgi:type I restriction enzyme S subunit
MSPFNFIEKLLDGVEVEWQPLEQVAKIKHGKDWKGLGVGDIPVYGSGGVMGYVDTYSYNKPTVLIPRKGTITNIFYIESPFWNVDTIYYTEIDNTKAIPKFFYYYMKTINLLALDAGTGRPSLTQAILNKIEIPIPPLNIQAEIVRILDAFTALTAELTAELTGRKKQYNYYRDQLILNSGAKSEKLKDISKIYLGLTYTPTYVEKGVKFISAQNTSSNYLNFTNVKYISEEEYEKSTPNAKPKRGDVLFTRVGSNLGHPVIVDTDEPLCMFVSLGFIRVNPKKVLSSYIKHWMNTDLFWDQVRKKTHGAAKINLNTGWLNDFDVLLPSITGQARIVAILDKFDALTNSITEGLPREIKLRQQQYEYYRDLLLSFPKPEDVGAQHE